MEPLEERLKRVSVDKDELVDALCAEKIRPRDVRYSLSYLKYDLSDRIEESLRKRGVHLDEKERSSSVSSHIYAAINKEPLKRVEYGIINSRGIPDEIFEHLTNWEAIYFLAGLWNKKSTPIESKQYRRDLLERQPVPLIVAETIETGIRALEKIHRSMVERGEYKSDIKLPYADEIMQRYYSLRTSFMRESQAKKTKPKGQKQLRLF